MDLQQRVEELGRRCLKCGWTWTKKPHAPEPRRCPNHQCRSKHWMTGPQVGEKIKMREPQLEPFND